MWKGKEGEEKGKGKRKREGEKGKHAIIRII